MKRGAAVSDIIGAGMLPAAIEMMDKPRHPSCGSGRYTRNYPNCGALLLVELDGPVAEVEALMTDVNEICRSNGASEIRVAQFDRRGTRAGLERAQVGVCSDGADLAELYCAGRGDSPHGATASVERN